MDPMERASSRDISNDGGDNSDSESDGPAYETPRKRQRTQRRPKAKDNLQHGSNSEPESGFESAPESGSGSEFEFGSEPGSGSEREDEPEPEKGKRLGWLEGTARGKQAILKKARSRAPRWTRHHQEVEVKKERPISAVVLSGLRGAGDLKAEKVLNDLEGAVERRGGEDEAQTDQDQDQDAEATTQGLDDVTLLKLFSSQIKTNLPRGTSKNVVKLLRKKVEQDNICRVPQFFDTRRGFIYHTLSRVPVYLEMKAYRPFDYNHKYDWMSPRSPLRQKNDEFYYEFKRTEGYIAEIQLNATDEDSVETRQTVRRHQKRLRNLDTRFHYVPIDIADRRCNWCSVRILDFRQRYLFESAFIDVKGVGLVPTLYDLDHEGKPLCLHCVAECGALLKEKRRFQTLYELTAVPEPEGCSHCGIRESIQFSPAFGLIGKTCHDCTVYHLKKAQYPPPPWITKEHFPLLVEAIVDSTDSDGIHWDRVANDASANPRFLYTAQGLLAQWLYRVKHPLRKKKMSDKPFPQKYSTYILLQHNHLTRRSQDWELYTCRAESPTHAALYFARFVALYKKRPMTYLYIRQVEDWNIPPPRTDEWEDLSSGLLTFDQLKSRVRKNVLDDAENPTMDECEQVEAKVVEQVRSNIREMGGSQPAEALGAINKKRKIKYRNLWKSRMKNEFGVLNKHLNDQLHWDEEENRRDFIEFRRHLPDIIDSYPTQKGTLLRIRRALRTTYHQRHAKAMKSIEAKSGVTKGLYGPMALDQLEDRSPHLPQWAKRNARDIAKKTIADNRLRRIHERHVLYERYRILDHLRQRVSKNQMFKFSRPFRERSLAADISKFTETYGAQKRNVQDCQAIAYSFRGANPDVPFDPPRHFLSRPLDPLRSPNNLRLQLEPRPDLSSDPEWKDYLQEIIEKDRDIAADLEPIVTTLRLNWRYKEPLDFAQRKDLPDAFESAATPSGQYPVHLLPAEYQVHVFQSVLIPESRTAHVRLVRTERYRRQGDCVQGGGPVQLPSVINSETTKGFYRESNRADRYKSSIKGPYSSRSRTDPDPVIFLRSQVDPKSGHGGVETWRPLEESSNKAITFARQPLHPERNLDSTDEEYETESDSEEEVEKNEEDKEGSEDEYKFEDEDKDTDEQLDEAGEADKVVEQFNGVPHQVQYEPTIDEWPEMTYFEDGQAFGKSRNRNILRRSIQATDKAVVLPSMLRKVAAYGQLDQYLPSSVVALDSDSDQEMDSDEEKTSKIHPLVDRELVRYAKLKVAVAEGPIPTYVLPSQKRMKEEI